MANLKLSPGVVTGNALKELFAYCKEVDCALPAVNVIGSQLGERRAAAAREAKAPIIIQLSHTGSQFFAGKSLDNAQQQASIAGSIAGALHVRTHGEGVRRPGRAAHRSLREEDLAVGRRRHRRGRGLLRQERRAAVQLAHAGPVGAAARREPRDQPAHPAAHREDEHDARDRARHHGRRGRRRRSLGRRSLEVVHAAGGRAQGVRRAQPGRQLHGRRRVRQHARRLRARQREAEAADPARFAEVHHRAAQDRARAGQLRVPRRLRVRPRRRSARRSPTAS